MFKTHFYFSILFFLFFSSGFSQKEISIKVIPQNLKHPDIPTLPFEIEYKFGKFGIEYNHGFKSHIATGSYDGSDTDFKKNSSYFRSRLGLKYYRKNNRVKQFYGFNISYTPINYNRDYGDFYYEGKDYEYTASSISIKHFKAAILYGFKLPFSKLFDIEFVSGIGLKYRIVKHHVFELRENNYEDDILFIDIDTLNENPGSAIVPYFLTNIKLNFNFYKSKKDTD